MVRPPTLNGPGWTGTAVVPPTLVLWATMAVLKPAGTETIGIDVGVNCVRPLIRCVLISYHHLAGRADTDIAEVAAHPRAPFPGY